MSIHLQRVASVHVQTGLLWSDVLIESTGGTDPIVSHGHRKADARRIQSLIEAAQTQHLPGQASDGADADLPLLRRDHQGGGQGLPLLRAEPAGGRRLTSACAGRLRPTLSGE